MDHIFTTQHSCERCQTLYRRKRERDRCPCPLRINPFGGGPASSGSLQESPSLPNGGTIRGPEASSPRQMAETAGAPATNEEETDSLSLAEPVEDTEVPDLSPVELGFSDGRESEESVDEDPESDNEEDGLAAFLGKLAERTAHENGEDEDESHLRGGGGDDDECSNHTPSDMDLEEYGDFQGNFEYVADPPDLNEIPVVDVGEGTPIPRLETLHRLAPDFEHSRTVEGGAEYLRYNTKAAGSPYYPFSTKEQLLIYAWQHTHQVSRKALGGLL
ncbi:unnamed protein product, partial [Scytosiphon promiscuus]